MLGKNLLWVAKQHGHSVQTMLDVYAAWIDGAKESDLEAIRRAMESSPRLATRSAASPALSVVPTGPLQAPEFGTNLAPEPRHDGVSRRMRWEMYGGKGGTRTRRRGKSDQ